MKAGKPTVEGSQPRRSSACVPSSRGVTDEPWFWQARPRPLSLPDPKPSIDSRIQSNRSTWGYGRSSAWGRSRPRSSSASSRTSTSGTHGGVRVCLPCYACMPRNGGSGLACSCWLPCWLACVQPHTPGGSLCRLLDPGRRSLPSPPPCTYHQTPSILLKIPQNSMNPWSGHQLASTREFWRAITVPRLRKANPKVLHVYIGRYAQG